MQIDMHYYGTYAMARAAGIPQIEANIIAYAAQFVDDSTRYDSEEHDDKGLLFGITTAHHPAQVLVRNSKDHLSGFEEQRKIWIPFHFFPGGKGETFEEKIICTMDSDIVNQMLDNHLRLALEKPYGLELLGLSAHVYQDTFAHYDFSGLSSEYNDVRQDTIKTVPNDENWFEAAKNKLTGFLAQFGSNSLGHGGGATLPDEPFLNWTCEFELNRPGNGSTSYRENQKTFLLSLEKLYNFFVKYAKQKYTNSEQVPFDTIKDELKELIAFKGDKTERCNKWRNAPVCVGVFEYDPEAWENQKKIFHKLKSSSEGISHNIYRFHQAAAYHRYYVLKDLLPEHGIAVY